MRSTKIFKYKFLPPMSTCLRVKKIIYLSASKCFLAVFCRQPYYIAINHFILSWMVFVIFIYQSIVSMIESIHTVSLAVGMHTKVLILLLSCLITQTIYNTALILLQNKALGTWDLLMKKSKNVSLASLLWIGHIFEQQNYLVAEGLKPYHV